MGSIKKEMQELAKKPTIREQINFIAGARHIVEEVQGGQVVFDKDNAEMLRAIEENLVAVRLLSGDING
jgi:hypothetical protein